MLPQRRMGNGSLHISSDTSVKQNFLVLGSPWAVPYG